MSGENSKVYKEQGGARQVVASGGSLDVESGAELDIESGGALKLAGVAVAATADEINRAADVSARIVNVTAATLAVTAADHDGKVVTLNKVDGQAVTLPAATGSGMRTLFVIGTTITSVGTTIKVTGNDTMVGTCFGLDDDGVPANAWTVGGTNDTITLDGSTTGGLAGDTVELIDIAADLWLARILIKQTGTEATPMSATV